MANYVHTDIAESSFESLYLAYRHKFRQIAISYLQDKEIAEDVVNDSFMYYWENKENLELDAPPPAYILGIVKKKCLTHLRSQSIHRKASEAIYNYSQWELKQNAAVLEDCDLTKYLFSKEVEAIFRVHVEKLPDMTRKVFLASREEYLTYQQIAEKYNLSGRQVVREMTHALSILRESLKDYLPITVIMILLFHYWE